MSTATAQPLLSRDAYTAYDHLRQPGRDPVRMLEQTRRQWRERDPQGQQLWVFGYASLIWRPDFEPAERHATRVHGWHRSLAMWSRVNRGTPEQPGLVFALLPGGSCQGMVFRVAAHEADAVFERLWAREMPSASYDPRWLRCPTPGGPVSALAFTLPRHSPSHAHGLSPAQYRHIFAHAQGRYGSTLDYARQTLDSLQAHGVRDASLQALLRHAFD